MTRRRKLSQVGQAMIRYGLPIVLVAGAVLLVLSVLFPTQDYDDRRWLSGRNLKSIVLAFHDYVDNNEYRLPPAVVTDKNGRPLYSWRVAILKYMDGDARRVYEAFHLDEPWDSEHNNELLRRMPYVYRMPFEDRSSASGLTCYQVFVGPGTAFERPG
jgi:hypothetical protein